MITFQLALALVMVSIYRLACVVYHSQRFFKTRKWFAISFISQWSIGFLLPLVSLSAANDSHCHYPQWVSVYTMVLIIIICPLISLVVNIRIFFFGHSAFRRLQCHANSNRVEPILTTIVTRTDSTNQSRPKLSHRDIRLLKHTIYLFSMFIIGWGPIYILMIIMHNTTVSTSLLGFFCLWAQISLVCLVITMFIFNNQLRKYLLGKIFPGF